MNKVKICVIGAGRWGRIHIQSLYQLNQIIGVVDIDKNKLKKIKSLFPELICFNSLEKSFNNNFDGYIVATPPSTHAELAKILLSKRIPVLVEKPLALSSVEANQIYSEMKKFDGKLIVGHLLLFHPAITKIKSLIENGFIGDIQYIYSNRLNLGVVRKEENVFWSFAPHDIALFQFFTGSFPVKVDSMGGAFIRENIHDTTITYLNYPNGIQGHIYVSWLHPFKEHRLVIIGSKGSLHFEDSSANKPLLFYEKMESDNFNSELLKNKPVKKIEYNFEFPLLIELKYFIDIIKGKESINMSNIKEGMNVIKILEMAHNSLKNK